MVQISRVFSMCGLVAGALVLGVSARAATNTPPQDVATALHQMADRADVIFVGQVSAVVRHDGGGVGSGFVEVDFTVDQAVRGCMAGEPYALREWAGLWQGGDRRYRVGQRLLMLLHGPGASGMSSPVDGLDGAIPIMRGGSARLVAGSSQRLAPPAVDLRWVGVKMLHPVSYRSGKGVVAVPSGQARVVRGAMAGAVEQVAPIVVAPVAAGGGSVPDQQASVDVVVGMLTSWQRVQHAGH